MSIQLKIEEMLEIIQLEIDEDAAKIFEDLALHLADSMAEVIRRELPIHSNCEVGPATSEGTAFGGICVPFRATVEDEPIPALIEGYDNEGWE
jgi:hypothetical protein